MGSPEGFPEHPVVCSHRPGNEPADRTAHPYPWETTGRIWSSLDFLQGPARIQSLKLPCSVSFFQWPLSPVPVFLETFSESFAPQEPTLPAERHPQRFHPGPPRPPLPSGHAPPQRGLGDKWCLPLSPSLKKCVFWVWREYERK